MSYKKYLYNSITLNIPKNAFQFAIGAVLYLFIFGIINIAALLIGCAGFLAAYSSVYLLNDLNDVEEDKKDKEKIRWKLVANGQLSVRTAKILMYAFAATGFLLSFIVSKWFFLLVLGTVLLNVLHSWKHTRLKRSKWKTSVNMTGIEFLKYSSGWFALSSNISKFPFWLILTFSTAYVIFYFAYKLKLNETVMKNNLSVFVPLLFTLAFSFFASIFLYSFPLSVIIITISMSSIFFLLRYTNIWAYSRIKDLNVLMNLVLIVPILSFLLMLNPVMAGLNEKVNATINDYGSQVNEKLPENLKEGVSTINEKMEKYSSLDEIEKDLVSKTIEQNQVQK
jgi:4-hydroxybenzoate polyprenyltransferase